MSKEFMLFRITVGTALVSEMEEELTISDEPVRALKSFLSSQQLRAAMETKTFLIRMEKLVNQLVVFLLFW